MDCRFKRYSRKKFARMCKVPEATFLANVRRLEKLLSDNEIIIAMRKGKKKK